MPMRLFGDEQGMSREFCEEYAQVKKALLFTSFSFSFQAKKLIDGELVV